MSFVDRLAGLEGVYCIYQQSNLRKSLASIPLYVKAVCVLGCKVDYHTVECLTCKGLVHAGIVS